MKRIVLNLMLLAGCFPAFAQSEMKPLTDVEDFKKKMAAETQKMNTIECDFTQIKHLTAVSGDIISKGKFYYQKEDKVSLDYTDPVKYLIVINGTKIKIVSNGKTSVSDIPANMKPMQETISACMTGNLQAMTGNYKMEYYQNSKEYLIKIFPQNEGAKAMLEGINIYLDKNDLSVSRLVMLEASRDKNAKDKDYTEYQFSNKKLNVSIPASRFSIK